MQVSALQLSFIGTTLIASLCVGDEKPKRFTPIGATLAGCKVSYYSPKIASLLERWPPPGIPEYKEGKNPVWMRPVKTPGHPSYVGIEKRVFIAATLERVAGLITDFKNYPNILTGVNSVKVVSQEGNRYETEWERESPVFFLSNPRYTMIYLIDDRSSEKLIVRYQLKAGSYVNYTDGLIVVEKSGNNSILTAVDFFDLDWGLARAFAEKAVWRKVVEGSYQADASFKALAEHPDWNRDKTESFAKKHAEAYPLGELEFAEPLFEKTKK